MIIIIKQSSEPTMGKKKSVSKLQIVCSPGRLGPQHWRTTSTSWTCKIQLAGFPKFSALHAEFCCCPSQLCWSTDTSYLSSGHRNRNICLSLLFLSIFSLYFTWKCPVLNTSMVAVCKGKQSHSTILVECNHIPPLLPLTLHLRSLDC